MAIAHEYDYCKPASLKEALEIKSKYKEKGWILAGGTDLIVQLKEGPLAPEMLIDMKGVAEFNMLRIQKDEMIIGPGITFSDLIESSEVKTGFPLLWEAATTVASVGTRNRATLVGNLCSAVPSLDSGPAILCYEAQIIVKNQTASREIPAAEWFLSPRKTALKSDEIVVGVRIQKPAMKTGSCYVKLGRYRGEDLAQAGLGVLVSEDNDYKLAFCALGPVPTRAHRIEKLLKGKTLNEDLIRQAAALAKEEISPITDIRSSKEYRLHIAAVMVERGLKKALDRLQGEKVEIIRVLGG